MRRAWVRAVLGVAAALAGACTSTAPNAVADENARVTERATPITAVRATPEPVRPGGDEPSTTSWDDGGVTADGRSLLVRYHSGACIRLDAVTTEESEDRVSVTITTAMDPGEDTCTLVGIDALAWVRLKEPLAGRLVVDGSSGKAPPVTRLPDGFRTGGSGSG